MIDKYPLAYDYLSSLKPLLETRSSLKRYLKNDPFYSCWNVGKYTFSQFKTCWREISTKLQACVLGTVDGQSVIPDHKIYFVAMETEVEAMYLCAILNSSHINTIVMNYAESTQIGTHIFDYVQIPIFNSENPIHLKLADLAHKAHANIISCDDAIQQIDMILSKAL